MHGAWVVCEPQSEPLWNLPNMECSIVQEPRAGGKKDRAGVSRPRPHAGLLFPLALSSLVRDPVSW